MARYYSNANDLITFSRGSHATVTDADGQIKWAPHNLLDYSSFGSGTGWILQASTLTAVSAEITLAPDGTATAFELEHSATTAGAAKYTSEPSVDGVDYTVGLYAKHIDGQAQYLTVFADDVYVHYDLLNGVIASDGSTNQTADMVSVGGGWYYLTVTEPAVGTGFYFQFSLTSAPPSTAEVVGVTAYVWGAHIYRSDVGGMATVPGAATGFEYYVPTNGSAVYSPRIDYDPLTGKVKGLLIEEERSNLITESTPQSGDLVTLGGSFSYVTCNFTPLSGPGIHFDTSGVSSYTYFTPTYTAADYTLSVFVEMDDGNAPTFDSPTGSAVANDFALVIDATQVNPLTYIVEHFGGNTYRVSGTLTSASTTARNTGVVKYIGNSSRTFKVTGFQLEQGSFPTSYIPTSGSTVTRSADLASIPVSAFGYNEDAGTVVAEYMLYDTGFSAIRNLAQLDDGTVGNRIVSQVNAAGKMKVFMNTAGSTQDNFGAEDVSEGVVNKTAMAFVENSTGLSTNGSAIENGDGTSVVPSVTTLRLGLHSNGNFPLNGHIKSIQYYPRRLTDAQLQKLTG